jgi:hypothetical protein
MPFAGVAWQVLHHLEGLRRLGHEVFYLEDTGRWPYDPDRDSLTDDGSAAARYLERTFRSRGYRWAYRDAATTQWFGATQSEVEAQLRDADVLINLSGVMLLEERHLSIPVRVYLETDPVLPQVEVAQGREFTLGLLRAHTHHFSYGTNFGAPDCGVPTSDEFFFRPALPPVVIDWWSQPDVGPLGGRPFTTVANWKQREKDLILNGERLSWSKDVQFMALIDLPSRSLAPLELALASDDYQAISRLRRAGWWVRDARPLSRDIHHYRHYIQSSAGEFSVAKEQNVRLRSGWFSDRSATYLAAGRPVVLQDTGFGRRLPIGEGLFAFTTEDDAARAIAEVIADYARHSRAALRLAATHLQAERVLGSLLEQCAATPQALTRQRSFAQRRPG